MDLVEFNLARFQSAAKPATPSVDNYELSLLRQFYASWEKLHVSAKRGRPSSEASKAAEDLVSLADQIRALHVPNSAMSKA